jgi:hypothetical protein
MNRITSWRSIAALGFATTIAVAAGIQVSSAQTEPRALPNLENQQDRQYDRGNGGQYGGQSDFRRERGLENRERRGLADPQERLDRRLAFLHTRLRITPAQERAWTGFAAVLQDEARERLGNRDGALRVRGERGRDRSVIERLEERQHRLADRNADLERVIRAVQPLYASFSEDQKRIADRMMFRPERNRRMADAGRGRGGFDRGGIDRRYDDRVDRYSR